MSVSCSALAHVASVMPTCTASEHRVLTAIALQVGDLEASVKLSLTELEQLTGLSRSGVRKGLEDAKASRRLNQVEDGNSFIYSLCHDVAQNVSPRSTPLCHKVTQNGTRRDIAAMSRRDTCVTTKHKTLHEVTQQPEPSLIPDLKERSSERPEVKPETREAFLIVERLVGFADAGWLANKRNFNFDQAVTLWGELLPELWQRALRAPNSKPGEKPIWRFQDACERKLDLGLEPPRTTPPPPVPDEHGLIIGQRYWHKRLYHSVLLDKNFGDGDYGADCGTDGVVGRFDIVRVEDLEPLRGLHAA